MKILRNGAMVDGTAAENTVIANTRRAALLDRAATDAAVKRARRHADLVAEIDTDTALIDLLLDRADIDAAQKIRLRAIRDG